jgi:hypothetical protein
MERAMPSEDDFKCKCCGVDNTKTELKEKLKKMEERLGYTLHLSSGTRCIKHNREEGGVDDSEHVTGDGVDVVVHNSNERFNVIEAAILEKIVRIEMNAGFERYKCPKCGKKPGFQSWVHVGISQVKPQRVAF